MTLFSSGCSPLLPLSGAFETGYSLGDDGDPCESDSLTGVLFKMWAIHLCCNIDSPLNRWANSASHVIDLSCAHQCDIGPNSCNFYMFSSRIPLFYIESSL